MPEHVVRQGECIESIAFAYGHFPDTIWDDPANAQLKRERGDKTTLRAGDVVFVPELRPKTHACAIDQRHTFRRRGVPSRLRIRLLDHRGEPRASLAYTIEIDRVAHQGTTDGDGWIDHPISPAAKRAILRLPPEGDDAPDEVHELALGHLDPLDTVVGIKGRLANLGFWGGPLDDESDDALAEAIQDFQAAHDLFPSGELDGPTRAAIADACGA